MAVFWAGEPGFGPLIPPMSTILWRLNPEEQMVLTQDAIPSCKTGHEARRSAARTAMEDTLKGRAGWSGALEGTFASPRIDFPTTS